jgi:hypothetical protein
MAKKALKRRQWTKGDTRDLKSGARQKAPARKVARSLKRTEGLALRTKSGRIISTPPAKSATTRGAFASKKEARSATAAKKIRHSDGTVNTVYTVRLGSKTFDSDLQHAFKKSIAKARRENKVKLGVLDYPAESI